MRSSKKRNSERTVEQTVDFPGGGLQDFRPGLSSSSSYFPAGVPETLDEPGQGFFFALFPKFKKIAKSGSHSTQRVPASFSPSTPAPQQRVRLKEWVMILNVHGLYFWNMDTGERRWQMEDCLSPRSWLTLATTDDGDVVVGLDVVASDGLSWCRLLVESAWSSVLSRSRVARCPLVRMAVMVVWWLD